MSDKIIKRPTVGASSTELLSQTPQTRSPIELEREMHKDYEQHVFQALERGKRDFAGDFFLVVVTKKERILQNVIRNYFFARSTCPTPEWDQTVYHYHRSEQRIEFLWVVPSKDTCELFMSQSSAIVPEEYGLLKYVKDFSDGTLMRLAKKLNGEVMTPGILLDA